MEFTKPCEPTKFWILTLLPVLELDKLHNITLILLLTFTALLICGLITWAYSTSGPAWKNGRHKMGRVPIPGLKGLPIFGSLFTMSHGLAHRTLARIASSHGATQLMAFSLGSTPVVVASDPNTAREILTSSHFASRPIKESAKLLMFTRAIGFAPDGSYWRMLRRIASTQLFAPRRIIAHESGLQHECGIMVRSIAMEQSIKGKVQLRKHLQDASLNNIMQIVFGKRYEAHDEEAKMLRELVREGFELLGAFNWSDHLPWLKYFYDPFRIQERCEELVPRVVKLVKGIIDEHKRGDSGKLHGGGDFVDILLSLEGDEKLDQEDMVAVLWEMIFRGTDTTSLLTEWIMAELILNPRVQSKLYNELQIAAQANNNLLTYAHISKLPYLDAVIKETLRLHPPGPLLSWARLSTSDVSLTNGMVIPAHATAMVNMWAITHDSNIWADPLTFKPERFIACDGGENIDVRGNDLRIAPFGAGRRVCPGKNLGMAIVGLWVAELVQNFKWAEDRDEPVDLSEELKLSCEMKKPLYSVVDSRI